MLTRCPTCDTGFRVTPEQLKIRSGQVRCGACQRIFSALDSLVEEPPVILNPPLPSESPPAEPALDAAIAVAPTDHELVDSLSDASVTDAVTPTVDISPIDAMALISETEPVAVVKQADSAPYAVVEPHVPRDEIKLDLNFDVNLTPQVESQATEHPPPRPPTPEPNTVIATPETTEPAPVLIETVHWHDSFPDAPKPARRWPWLIASVLALLVLIVQSSIAMRVDWASRYPDAKPALELLCSYAGCQIDLPQKVELLEIETSNLQPDGKNPKLLSLTATLKNRAQFAQQFPALEITLTDTSDKAVARKVLAPKDYLPAGANPASGMAPFGDFSVAVTIDPNELTASGYRLYLFYP